MEHRYQWILDKFGPWLTLDEAASVLKRASGKTLREQVWAGKCDLKLKKMGGKYKVTAEDLAEYMNVQEKLNERI